MSKIRMFLNQVIKATTNQIWLLKENVSNSKYENFLFILIWLTLLTLKTLPKFTPLISGKIFALVIMLSAIFIYNLNAVLFLVSAIIILLLIPFVIALKKLGVANSLSSLGFISLVLGLFVVPIKDSLLAKMEAKNKNCNYKC